MLPCAPLAVLDSLASYTLLQCVWSQLEYKSLAYYYYNVMRCNVS